MQTRNKARWRRGVLVALVTMGLVLVLFPSALSAHPMGNFSISHYAGIQLEGDFVESGDPLFDRHGGDSHIPGNAADGHRCAG